VEDIIFFYARQAVLSFAVECGGGSGGKNGCAYRVVQVDVVVVKTGAAAAVEWQRRQRWTRVRKTGDGGSGDNGGGGRVAR
jgi:hypothetical protein